jgi:hypothetical protein
MLFDLKEAGWVLGTVVVGLMVFAWVSSWS